MPLHMCFVLLSDRKNDGLMLFPRKEFLTSLMAD